MIVKTSSAALRKFICSPARNSDLKTGQLSPIGSSALQETDIHFPVNPLDGCQFFVSDLVSRVIQACKRKCGMDLQKILLNVIRELFQAEYVVLMQMGLEKGYLIFQSNGTSEDGPQKLSLRDLYRLGIRYLQGYLVGSSGPDVYRFNKCLEFKIKNLLSSGA
jgi:hypothetical protein